MSADIQTFPPKMCSQSALKKQQGLRLLQAGFLLCGGDCAKKAAAVSGKITIPKTESHLQQETPPGALKENAEDLGNRYIS